MSGAAVVIMIRRARQDIVRHFTAANATNPERAIAYDPDAAGWRVRRMRRRQFDRLRDFGAIREARSGLFYLDEERLGAFVRRMRKRAVGLIGLAGAAVLAALAFTA